MIYDLILFCFVFYFVYFYFYKNNENFINQYDSKCHNHLYVCQNYDNCCLNDNYYKLGHSKYCNDVYHVKNCNIYKTKNKKKYNNQIKPLNLSYLNYFPGFVFKPSYKWESNYRELCST